MSKIAYTQLVKNIADSYREATGSTEPVVIGELASKIGEAIRSGSSSGTASTMSVENSVEVIQPVTADPTVVEINNSNIEIETSVALESGE